MKHSSGSPEVKYGKFAVVDSPQRALKAQPSSDAGSPALSALKAKIKAKENGIAQAAPKGVAKAGKSKVEFKRALPRTAAVDGAASSKVLIVKNGKVIGAQG